MTIQKAHNPISKAKSLELKESKQFSSNLYHFKKEPNRIVEVLENSYMVANLVREPMGFIGAEGLPDLFISMICFCDIPLVPNRIKPHIERYGSYGIGFQKEWAMRNGITPVHYIVPSSPYIKDYLEAYEAALGSKRRKHERRIATLANFLITQLAFFKPVQDEDCCYEDECEWRYVPSPDNDWKVILSELTESELHDYREAQKYEEAVRLHFDYGDITHILVPDEIGIGLFLSVINGLECDLETKDSLKTKLRIVGDNRAW